MSKIEALRQHVLRLYREHLAAGMLPTSIRFLFYELVALSIVSKQASGVLRPGAVGQRRPDQDVIDAITELTRERPDPVGRDRRRDAQPRRLHRLGVDRRRRQRVLERDRARSVERLRAADSDRKPIARRRAARSHAGISGEDRADQRPDNGFLRNDVAPTITDDRGALSRRLGLLRRPHRGQHPPRT